MSGKRSMREAINAKCKWCIYDDKAEGTWRKQVELCTCTDCPLHTYRPVTTSKSLQKGPMPAGLKAYHAKRLQSK